MNETSYRARLRKLKTGYYAFYLPKEAIKDNKLKPNKEYVLLISEVE